jgi:hypothetical protein
MCFCDVGVVVFGVVVVVGRWVVVVVLVVLLVWFVMFGVVVVGVVVVCAGVVAVDIRVGGVAIGIGGGVAVVCDTPNAWHREHLGGDTAMVGRIGVGVTHDYVNRELPN